MNRKFALLFVVALLGIGLTACGGLLGDHFACTARQSTVTLTAGDITQPNGTSLSLTTDPKTGVATLKGKLSSHQRLVRLQVHETLYGGHETHAFTLQLPAGSRVNQTYTPSQFGHINKGSIPIDRVTLCLASAK